MHPARTPKIRVYLVDDHPVVREGLARALADDGDFRIVGEASTGSEGLAGAPGTRPDMVLVDLHLPDLDGVELLGGLRAVLPEAKLVVVSGYDDEYRVAEALRAGAHGYLLKTAPIGEILSGVRVAADGGMPLSPQIMQGVVRALRKGGNGASGTIEVLTARELQVLRLLASGVPTRDAARSLGISPKTVETHRVRIYDKLGCRGMVDLTRIAVRSGLIEA